MVIIEMREEQKQAEWLLNMPFCVFCKGFHRSEHCTQLGDTVTRIYHLLKMGLCLVCLSHDTSLSCPRTSYICSMCDHMNHHVAICYLHDVREDVVDIYEHELTEDKKQ